MKGDLKSEEAWEGEGRVFGEARGHRAAKGERTKKTRRG